MFKTFVYLLSGHASYVADQFPDVSEGLLIFETSGNCSPNDRAPRHRIF